LIKEPQARSTSSVQTIDHFTALLYWLDASIARSLKKHEETQEGSGTGSLYISEGEVSKLLNQGVQGSVDVPLERRLDKLDLPANIYFDHLVNALSLNVIDRFILYITLAPNIHEKYLRLYGYLHDNISKNSASLSLLQQLLSENLEDRIQIQKRLITSAPLIRYNILCSNTNEVNLDDLRLNPELINYLLGGKPLNWVAPTIQIQTLNEAVNQPLGLNVNSINSNIVYSVIGAELSELKIQSKQLVGKWKRSMIEIDLLQIGHLPNSELASKLLTIFILSILNKSVLLVSHSELLIENHYLASTILAVRRQLPSTLIWILLSKTSISTHPNVEECFSGLNLHEQSIKTPPLSSRIHFWKKLLPQDLQSQADWLGPQFPFTSKQIRLAYQSAVKQASTPSLTLDDLLAGCRSQQRTALDKLAKRIPTSLEWKDLILPEPCKQHLTEIETYVSNLQSVRSEWGFSRRVTKRGLAIMFCGESGVGKTMAASILAKSLKVDLYRIDLSSIVSKYIGETEKHIAEVFTAAEASGAALFFDEADALFGKRTEVNDSHDRYANQETSYLLQKMEDFDGLVILATNLRQNIDQAFLRRIHQLIEFPFPSSDQRLLMWKAMIPEPKAIGEDVDFSWLAQNIVLTGGHLHHVTLNAAIRAKAEGSVICMRHIQHAVQREFNKLQKTYITLEWPSKDINEHEASDLNIDNALNQLVAGGTQ